MRLVSAVVFCLTLALAATAAETHDSEPFLAAARLPIIRPAPEFALVSQDGDIVTLDAFGEKILAVNFIYTNCVDTCPVLTSLMIHVQEELGEEFGKRVEFVSITLDPAHDTPEVLRHYADAHGAGWTFLTGSLPAIREIARKYGVLAVQGKDGVSHNLLTSLIDRQGMLRVQYVGTRFNVEEFRRDLLNLMNEH
jgi:protein SCO1